MEMINAKQAAQRWGVTPRFVQMLCKQGRIPGATQWGRAWMIPADAERPGERESKQPDLQSDMPLPRKTPFLDMTDLYHTPGCAAQAIEQLAYHPEAQILFEAEIAYLQGDIDSVYERASYLLGKHSGFYAVLSAGMLLGLCAMWRGDMEMWKKAKQHICEAPCKDDNDRDIVSLSLTALDGALYDTTLFPEWFKMGNFEPLHPDALPAAKVFYSRFMYVVSYMIASKQLQVDSIPGMSMMIILPSAIEPMITQAIVDKTVIVELYLRLICAVTYYNNGNKEHAVRHIDRAIALALPDRLYGVLAEYRRHFDTLFDSRLERIAPEATESIIKLQKTYVLGWSKLSGAVRNRNIATTLTVREREVAKLAAFGMSNAEIAQKLHISVASVKQSIRIVIFKGGIQTREEIAAIL